MAQNFILKNVSRGILYDAMQGILPNEILLRRSKIGFNAPILEWFNTLMKPLIKKILDENFWLDNPFWDGKKLKDYVLEKCKYQNWSKSDWEVALDIWTKINFVVFFKIFYRKQKRISL